MKRQIQQTGVRKWFGDDLLELQAEAFKVLDTFFGEYGEAIVSGCRVTLADNGLFNISAGVVALTATTPDADVVMDV